MGCAGPQLPQPSAWGVGKGVTGDPVPPSPRSPERVGQAGRGGRWIINLGALAGARRPYWSPTIRPGCPWQEAALLVPPGPSPSLSPTVRGLSSLSPLPGAGMAEARPWGWLLWVLLLQAVSPAPAPCWGLPSRVLGMGSLVTVREGLGLGDPVSGQTGNPRRPEEECGRRSWAAPVSRPRGCLDTGLRRGRWPGCDQGPPIPGLLWTPWPEVGGGF